MTGNNITKIRQEIMLALTKMADPKTKEKILRLTSGAKCVGVTVPDIRAICTNIKKQFVLTIDDAFFLADAVFPDMCREEILAAIFIIAAFPKKLLVYSLQRILPWLDYLDNWETCDQLASNIAAIMITKNPNDFLVLQELTEKDNLWKKRFAVATAANCNHGKFFFPDETLCVCEKLLQENETAVAKAVGWAIREVYKKDEAKTKAFIASHKDLICKKLHSELKGLE